MEFLTRRRNFLIKTSKKQRGNFAKSVSHSPLGNKLLVDRECTVIAQRFSRPTKTFLSHLKRKTRKMMSASLNIWMQAELQDHQSSIMLCYYI